MSKLLQENTSNLNGAQFEGKDYFNTFDLTSPKKEQMTLRFSYDSTLPTSPKIQSPKS